MMGEKDSRKADTVKMGVFCLLFAAFVLACVLWILYDPDSEMQNVEYRPLEPVTVAIATDLHYLSPELTDHGACFQNVIENGDGKVMGYCEEVTDAFVNQIIEQKPDVLILSGDLTFNGARMSHEMLAEKLQMIENAGIPVLVLPGNHDLENPMAASFHGDSFTLVDSVDGQQFEEIYQMYGFEDALERDEASLSYIVELTPELRILMLDVNTVSAPGILTEETLRWTEQQLREAAWQGIRVLAVSHQNLLRHNYLFSGGFVMGNSDSLLELYEEYGVICSLSGHMHVQHIAQSTNGLNEIATSSLMVSPNQYGILTLEGTSADYHTVPVNVPSWAGAYENTEFSDFPAYARAFLCDTLYQQALVELTDHSDEEQMGIYFADMGSAYVSGRMDEAEWNDTLFQSWKEQQTFLPVYLQSIYDDGFKNHTEYSFIFQ